MKVNVTLSRVQVTALGRKLFDAAGALEKKSILAGNRGDKGDFELTLVFKLADDGAFESVLPVFTQKFGEAAPLTA
jgi:hypothetical protein